MLPSLVAVVGPVERPPMVSAAAELDGDVPRLGAHARTLAGCDDSEQAAAKLI
jgi:hypothetical protein